jgi:hypothetical protein
MHSLLGIGVLVMILADAVVGVRLLLLARRTRELPELCFGLSFVWLGVLGYPLSIVARRTGSPGLLAAALFFQDLGSLAMIVATWQTFRPGEAWPRRLFVLACGLFAASLLGDSLTARAWLLRDGGPWYEVGFWARAGSYLWAAVASGRYFVAIRRRLALGIADPVLVDRFRLWTLSSAAISLAFLVFYLGRIWSDDVSASLPVLAVTSVVGLVAGVTVWLVFLPPPAYLRRVRARHLAVLRAA